MQRFQEIQESAYYHKNANDILIQVFTTNFDWCLMNKQQPKGSMLTVVDRYTQFVNINDIDYWSQFSKRVFMSWAGMGGVVRYCQVSYGQDLLLLGYVMWFLLICDVMSAIHSL